jgi:hypothetical protein
MTLIDASTKRLVNSQSEVCEMVLWSNLINSSFSKFSKGFDKYYM